MDRSTKWKDFWRTTFPRDHSWIQKLQTLHHRGWNCFFEKTKSKKMPNSLSKMDLQRRSFNGFSEHLCNKGVTTTEHNLNIHIHEGKQTSFKRSLSYWLHLSKESSEDDLRSKLLKVSAQYTAAVLHWSYENTPSVWITSELKRLEIAIRILKETERETKPKESRITITVLCSWQQ